MTGSDPWLRWNGEGQTRIDFKAPVFVHKQPLVSTSKRGG
jgi:hypothetical protein